MDGHADSLYITPLCINAMCALTKDSREPPPRIEVAILGMTMMPRPTLVLAANNSFLFRIGQRTAGKIRFMACVMEPRV